MASGSSLVCILCCPWLRCCGIEGHCSGADCSCSTIPLCCCVVNEKVRPDLHESGVPDRSAVIPNPIIGAERENETFTESLGQRSTGSTYYLRVDDRFAYSDAWVARIQRQQQKKSEPGPMPSAYYNVEPNRHSTHVEPNGHNAYYNVGPNGHGAHYNVEPNGQGAYYNVEPNGQGAYYNVEPNGPIAYYNVEPDWRNARVSPHTLQPRPYRESVHIRKKRSNEKSARLPHHLHSKATTSSSPRSNYRKMNSLSQSREVDDDDDETSESDVDEHNVHVELVSDI